VPTLAGVTVGLIGALHGDTLAEPRRGALAAAAVSALAAAHVASADALRVPGALALTLVHAVLGAPVLVLAARALGRPRSRQPVP
jgi:uncharacterized membrane protein YeaQ/YmgE (transglycosylase-associated protein family)